MNKLFIVLAVAFLVSCGKEVIPPPPTPGPGPAPVPLKKISITDTAGLLLRGTSLQLQAYFPTGTDSSAGLSWTSTDTSVASVNTLGTVTGKKKGQSFIIAKDQRNVAVSDSTPVYVLGDKVIHMVGTASNMRWRNAAYYWKNEVATQLPGVLMEVGPQASSVQVYQGSVYIAGTTLSPNHWFIPTYWKDGVPALVADAGVSYNSWVNDMLVDDAGIHLVGHDYRDYGCNPDCYSGTKGHYWNIKGSQVTETPLHGSNDSISTSVTSLARNGSDLIFGGQTIPYHYWGLATTWKNNYQNIDSFTHLSWAAISDIVVTGNGIVSGGSDGCPWTNCTHYATVWDKRNGTTIRLSDRGSVVNALALDGNKIIAAGFEYNSAGIRQAACWVIENGQVTSLNLGNVATPSGANGLFVKDGEYFIVGYTAHEATGNNIGTLWRAYQSLSIMLPQYSTSPWNGPSALSGVFVE